MALKKDYEELQEMLKYEKKQILRDAKGEAKRILDGANKQVERAVREIKESKADKQKTKQIRHEIEKSKESVKAEVVNKSSGKQKFNVGDWVKLEGQNNSGEIIAIKRNEAQVRFGSLNSFVKTTQLIKVGSPNKKQQKSQSNAGSRKFDQLLSFSPELNLIGKRGEEALPEIDSFVDQAIVVGAGELRVVHGKGHGILRDMLRNHLKDHPHISNIEDEHPDRGGSGISIISMK